MDRREWPSGVGPKEFNPFAVSDILSNPPPCNTPYDPVAVLEAMRERKIRFGIDTLQFDGFVRAEWPNGDFAVDENDIAVEDTDTMLFPDFTSAVSWLHQQAAAADKTFAEKWPVPE